MPDRSGEPAVPCRPALGAAEPAEARPPAPEVSRPRLGCVKKVSGGGGAAGKRCSGAHRARELSAGEVVFGLVIPPDLGVVDFLEEGAMFVLFCGEEGEGGVELGLFGEF